MPRPPARRSQPNASLARPRARFDLRSRAQERASTTPDEGAYRAELERRKRGSTLQVLFKVARLLDEEALQRAAALHPGRPRLRRSHTSLFPHIDLEGTRITELAERLGVTKQAVSQLVDDLEALGVLARVPDPDDARAKRVVFTKLGREGLLEGLALLRSLELELEQSLGEKPMANLRTSLLAIHDALAPRE